MNKILVTGGAGYIGSHTCLELLNHGMELVVIDNSSNANLENLRQVAIMSKVELEIQSLPSKSNSRLIFLNTDIRNGNFLREIFSLFKFDSVIHFAGLKSVSESIVLPLKYYQNNLSGTLTLIDIMSEFNCKNLVFSSSATVYGVTANSPISENSSLSTTNPYGASKLILENILTDLYESDKNWSIAILRYFNPVGAHNSGLIGEDPNNTPTNLMPLISEVAIGRREKLYIYGGDYPTHDGTAIRDFIHVVDLAKGHLKALIYLKQHKTIAKINLGTGLGYSVLEMVKSFEKTINNKIEFEIVARRPGDAAISYSNPKYANEILNWKAEYNIDQMCQDTWRWQLKNAKSRKK